MASPGRQMHSGHCLKVGTGPADESAIVEIQHLLPESMLWSASNIYSIFVQICIYLAWWFCNSSTPLHQVTICALDAVKQKLNKLDVNWYFAN